ncbi:NnrU family protein [Tropicibacter sp. R16_0]|uniref:NnrU family protein n=1 Tax=Tropicibacter sp. R16_0 TaxID=2821102 RepID=UPI001AD9BEC0|nr:NnrU family protein [Tropicibacter sp. R16_0]MBO9449352.1 NnrU family protein [Tropicibacter sp. R16_0]
MIGWFEFSAALVVFFLSHAIPVRPPVRPWLVSRLGQRGYLLAYSALSIAILVWLFVAAARAPFVAVIPAEAVLRWVPLVLMPLVSVLAVAGLRATNPLSFGGMGQGAFDPMRPGVLAVSRHPILLAAALWATAHLLVNGDLAHVILFGLMGGFALIGMRLIDRRKRQEMGHAWEAAAARTAVFNPRGLARVAVLDWVLGAGLFALLLLAHETVIGLSPLPV